MAGAGVPIFFWFPGNTAVQVRAEVRKNFDLLDVFPQHVNPITVDGFLPTIDPGRAEFAYSLAKI